MSSKKAAARESCAVLEGLLVKRGGWRGGFKNWKRRRFVLEPDCLLYYRTSVPTLLGVVNLSRGGLVSNLGEEQGRRVGVPRGRWGFLVSTPERDLYLYAETATERRSWVEALRAVLRVEELPPSELPASPAALHQEREERSVALRPWRSSLLDSVEEALDASPPLPPPRPGAPKAAKTPCTGPTGPPRVASPSSPPLTAPVDSWEIEGSAIEVQELVGRGSFGCVYRGRLWGSMVAVKRLRCPEVTASVLEALKREVSVLSSLRHPNCVLYIGACTRSMPCCLVTEWCEHGSLFQVLRDDARVLGTREMVRLALQMAQGMAYLHNRPKPLIHRDLKSHNVLVGCGLQAKIADFGLTVVNDLPDDASGAWGIRGTPQWMAPEMLVGLDYNSKIDVYSLGVVLTELFTRKMPFTDRFVGLDFIDAVLEEGARPTVPGWASRDRSTLRELVDRCLSRDPRERPDFDDVVLQLSAVAEASDERLCVEYDLPRLAELLEGDDARDVLIAAREIAATARRLRSSPPAASAGGCDVLEDGGYVPSSATLPSLGGSTDGAPPSATEQDQAVDCGSETQDDGGMHAFGQGAAALLAALLCHVREDAQHVAVSLRGVRSAPRSNTPERQLVLCTAVLELLRWAEASGTPEPEAEGALDDVLASSPAALGAIARQFQAGQHRDVFGPLFVRCCARERGAALMAETAGAEAVAVAVKARDLERRAAEALDRLCGA